MRIPLTRGPLIGYHSECKVTLLVVAITEAKTLRATNLSLEFIGTRQKLMGPE